MAARLLCLMPTFQCTAECAQCGTSSSPRDRTWLPLESMIAAIDQAATLGYTGVVFTGGEPTLAGDILIRAMRHAAARGLPVRLVTNAYWAATDGAAEQHLFDWICAGLAELNVSTGDEHARFVPVENVVRAVAAARRIGLETTVIVEIRAGNRLTPCAIRAWISDPTVPILEWVWSSLAPFPPIIQPGVTRETLDAAGGCEGLFTHTTIQANGAISPCCGLGIRVIPELQTGRAGAMSLAEADALAKTDPMLVRIRNDGPERLLAEAADADPSIEWEGRYAHRCHACIRVFKDPAVRRALGHPISRLLTIGSGSSS